MNEWMNSPILKDLDPVKLELIKMAASQTRGKTGKNLAPVMLSLISSANSRGIRFTPEEISLILDVLKEDKSPAQRARIDQMVQMVRGMQKSQDRPAPGHPPDPSSL